MRSKGNLQARKYFFISPFYHWGGTVTFTVHLLNKLGVDRIWRISESPKTVGQIGDFSYGIDYIMGSPSLLGTTENPFIADLFCYNHFVPKLKRSGVTVVIHDPTEIPSDASCLQFWNVVCIRKAFQKYLKEKYSISSNFMYHPFYPYDINDYTDVRRPYEKSEPHTSISICRIEYGKNIEIIIGVNRLLERNPTVSNDRLIRMYGPFNRRYVDNELGGEETFKRFYCGTFPKSFSAISNILHGVKFVIDLSTIDNDGGGTQYSFLEAIYHGVALVINRKWIENVPNDCCDFKEGYNCYAVSNAEELSQLLSDRNIDTSKIVTNSKQLLARHVESDWSCL